MGVWKDVVGISVFVTILVIMDEYVSPLTVEFVNTLAEFFVKLWIIISIFQIKNKQNEILKEAKKR